MALAIKRDIYIWPLLLAAMFFLVTSKGGSQSETLTGAAIGFAVGSMFAFGLSRIRQRMKLRIALNYLIALLWGLILLGIGYPNLIGPNGAVDGKALSYLTLVCATPLLGLTVYLGIAAWRYRR